MNLRACLCFLLSVALAPMQATAADEPFPARAITVVCPFPPGSTSDLLPRALAPLLSQSMGVPVVVKNRPGATGSIGAALVARAESFPARNLEEMIALAKLKPNSISFASAGNGSTSHLCGELLKTLAGIGIVHVPYKGPGADHQ